MIQELVIEGLALARGGRQLFEALSFDVKLGQAVALVAPNGAGKTSLLRSIAGLIRPVAGAIRFVSKDGAVDPADARARHLHFLGHDDGLKSGRRAGEELAFWTRWSGADGDAVARVIEMLDLQPLLPLDIRKLSAGQRRRLALARLLAAPRSLWLLDEPLAPLDAARRAQAGALMAEHLRGGGMIVAAVHDPLPVPAREIALGTA